MFGYAWSSKYVFKTPGGGGGGALGTKIDGVRVRVRVVEKHTSLTDMKN